MIQITFVDKFAFSDFRYCGLGPSKKGASQVKFRSRKPHKALAVVWQRVPTFKEAVPPPPPPPHPFPHRGRLVLSLLLPETAVVKESKQVGSFVASPLVVDVRSTSLSGPLVRCGGHCLFKGSYQLPSYCPYFSGILSFLCDP